MATNNKKPADKPADNWPGVVDGIAKRLPLRWLIPLVLVGIIAAALGLTYYFLHKDESKTGNESGTKVDAVKTQIKADSGGGPQSINTGSGTQINANGSGPVYANTGAGTQNISNLTINNASSNAATHDDIAELFEKFRAMPSEEAMSNIQARLDIKVRSALSNEFPAGFTLLGLDEATNKVFVPSATMDGILTKNRDGSTFSTTKIKWDSARLISMGPETVTFVMPTIYPDTGYGYKMMNVVATIRRIDGCEWRYGINTMVNNIDASNRFGNANPGTNEVENVDPVNLWINVRVVHSTKTFDVLALGFQPVPIEGYHY